MKKKLTIFVSTVFSVLLTTASVSAQEVWSLQRCIGYAQENNLSIKQSQAMVRTAQLGESQARASRLPNLSANANLGEQYGRTIDPTSNAFVTSGITFNSLGLNASLPLYQGGRITHSIKQAQHDAQAAEADLAQASNDLALQVAQAYLSILLAKEQVSNAKDQLGLSQKQLTNTQKLIDVGNLPQGDIYNVQAQIAREEQTTIAADNSLDLAYLNLKQLMQLEPDYPMEIEVPLIRLDNIENYDAYSLAQVYEIARNTQPNVQASELRIKSAQEGVGSAKSAYLPSVSAFGNLSSNYSSQFVNAVPIGQPKPGPEQTILVNGQDVSVSFYQQDFDLQKVPYFEQVSNNFGQGFGLNLNVPIYQNGNARLSVERAKLSVLNAELQNNQVQQQLKNDIQTSLANVRAAKKQLEAAQKTNEAAQLAYGNTEKRNSIGAANTLEVNTAKNTFDIASNNLAIARYDYLFRVKILEFYLGKPLLLN